ncbi:MAG: hypothetical protein WC551_09175 [Patescibacteria group bacterium]
MTIDQIEDDAIRGLVEDAMRLRLTAANMEKEAEGLKRQANDTLLALFDTFGDDKVEWEGVGSVSRVTATRTTVNNDLLKENLVAKGVSVNVVISCFDAASKTTESTSVRFTAEKVK